MSLISEKLPVAWFSMYWNSFSAGSRSSVKPALACLSMARNIRLAASMTTRSSLNMSSRVKGSRAFTSLMPILGARGSAAGSGAHKV